MAHTIGQDKVLKTLLLCFLLTLFFFASLILLPPSVIVKPNSLAVHIECWLFFEGTFLFVVSFFFAVCKLCCAAVVQTLLQYGLLPCWANIAILLAPLHMSNCVPFCLEDLSTDFACVPVVVWAGLLGFHEFITS